MSNYLNNLVVRQLDRASLVQPRLPSLFEPPAYPRTLLQHGQSDAVAPFNVETIEVESEINAPSETRHSNDTRVNSPSPRADVSNEEMANSVWRGRQQITPNLKPSAESTPDEIGEDSSQVAATHIQASHSTPTPTQTDAASRTPPSSNAPEETATPRQNVRRPAPQPTAAIEWPDKEREDIASPWLKPSTIDAAHVNSTKNDIELMESGIESVKNSIESTRKGVESTKNSLVVQPRVVSLVENRRERLDSSLPVQSPASESPPIINVTIGRIEVRAATAASSTPRRSEPLAKPLMSLDEYLRRRTKGGGA